MHTAVIGNFIALLLAAIAVAGVFASSWRLNRNNSLTQQYRDAASGWEAETRAYKNKAERQEQEIEHLQEAIHVKNGEIEHMKGEMTVLRDMVTGKSAIEALAVDLNNQLSGIFSEIRGTRAALINKGVIDD